MSNLDRNEKLYEYQMLRTEIMETMKAQNTTVATCLTFFGVILTIAFQQHNYLIPTLAVPFVFFFF